MQLVQLKDYTLKSHGAGNGLSGIDFSLHMGDCYWVQSDTIDDAALFLKALATLKSPIKGTYWFKNSRIDLSDYRNPLFCKQQIGYISSDAALISNRSIRENLLLMRSFHEDSLSLALDDGMLELCRQFDILGLLDRRPADLHPRDIQNVVTVRELSKNPVVLLLESPEDFIDHSKYGFFNEVLSDLSQQGVALVFSSSDQNFVKAFSCKKVVITNGRLNVL